MNSNGGKILFVVILIGIGVSTYLRSSNRAASERFEQTASQLRQKAQTLVQRQLAGEEVGEDQEKLFNEIVVELDKVSNEANGEYAKGLKAIVMTMREVQTPLKNYNATLAGLTAAGGVAAQDLKTPADIDARLALVEKLRVAIEELDGAYKALPDRLAEKLKTAGVSDIESFKAVNAFRASANLDTAAKVRQSDRELVAAMRGQFELLKADFGKWKLANDGAVEFQNPASTDKFLKLYQDIQAAAQQQEKLLRQASVR